MHQSTKNDNITTTMKLPYVLWDIIYPQSTMFANFIIYSHMWVEK